MERTARGVNDPVDHGKSHVYPRGPGPNHEYQRNHEDVERKSNQDIDGPHHQRVHPTTPVAGERAHHGAEAKRKNDSQEADAQVGPGRPDEPGELVFPKLVGPQQMFGRKPAQDVVKVLVVRRVGAYQRGQQGAEHQRERDGSTDYERGAAACAAEQDVARPPRSSAPAGDWPCGSRRVVTAAGSSGRGGRRAGRWPD